jgi:coenzyme PQQ synthesis protein D (PqqD)
MNGRLPEVTATTVLGPAADVAWVAIGDEVVVYRVAGAASLVLNSTAGLLWQCLDGASPLHDIFDDLADAFGENRAEVERDCVPVVSTWLAEKLVQEVAGG